MFLVTNTKYFFGCLANILNHQIGNKNNFQMRCHKITLHKEIVDSAHMILVNSLLLLLTTDQNL